MTVTIKQLEKLSFKKNQALYRIKVIKERLRQAAFMAHIKTCKQCQKRFAMIQHMKDSERAREATENLMSSLISKSLH
jgi:hypothetical protein